MSNAQDNGITFLAKAGAFLKGLSLLQTMNVCLLGSSFAMSRFGYNPEAVGIFVGMCHNSIELFYLVSAIGAFVLLRCLDQIPEQGLRLKKWCSIVNSWIIVLLNVLLLKSYAWVEGNENIVLYYWTLIAANFFAGADDMIMYDIASHNMASYDLGESCTGIFVAGLHWCTIYFLRKAKKDIDYGLNACHIFVLLVLSLLAAMVWTFECYLEISGSGTTGTGGEASAPGTGDCSFLKPMGEWCR
ncbi:hypothetical protein BaOVIS_026560 [Babesia ovis]|uniref:Uncharacterized protein n=1 Tax=Babesia ovis TaxID=5869 RepID=A0A9W5TBS8_BABOV|nr:hypothetical protein BaOVIS_026560 [Babesia ovis]